MAAGGCEGSELLSMPARASCRSATCTSLTTATAKIPPTWSFIPPATRPSVAVGSATPAPQRHLMPYVRRQVLTLLHELGHHLWNLGEEYLQATTSHIIDSSAPAPNARTVPIQPSGLSTDQLVDEDADALLTINAQLERRPVVANTATSITVGTDFSALPTDADIPTARIQRPAECADSATANFCIMEHSRAAGRACPRRHLDAGDQPDQRVLHRHQSRSRPRHPSGDTQRRLVLGDHRRTPGYTGLTLPNPAVPAPSPGRHQFPSTCWTPTRGSPSWSTAAGRWRRQQDARRPARRNLLGRVLRGCRRSAVRGLVQPQQRRAASADGRRHVDLRGAPAAGHRIDAITPDGATNIRDALLASLTEISSVPTRAATQVAVLLTDGMHNSPFFSSAQRRCRSCGRTACGLRTRRRDATEVDIPTLDDISTGTGGRSYAVGTAQPNEIEADGRDQRRGARRAHRQPSGRLPDSGTGLACKKLKGHLKPGGERPQWKAVAELLGLEPGDDSWQVDLHDPCVWTLRIPVEKGAGRASFTLLHPESSEVWLYLLNPDGSRWTSGVPVHHHVRSAAPTSSRSSPTPTRVVDPDPGTPRRRASYPLPRGGRGREQTVAYLRHGPRERAAGRDRPGGGWRSYRLPLTGLHVTARLTTPGGAQVAFTLTDVDGAGEDTGGYRGAFTATEIGRYHGVITIEGAAGAQTALGLTRLLHLEDDGPVDLTSDAPPFRRTIPLQVLVRRRGTEVEEDEREKKYAQPDRAIWERPRRLSSHVPYTA